MEDEEIMAYKREDGSVGVRNHVALLGMDHAGSVVVNGVEKLTRGARAIPHQYGRLQIGDDLDLTFRTLIGHGCNPNVAAVVVVGIEPNWTGKVAEEIKERTGKPNRTVHVTGKGTIEAIKEATKHAKDLVSWASGQKREPCKISDMTIGVKCGASDTTSGFASNPVIGKAGNQILDWGGTFIFGETTEVAGAEDYIAEKFADEEREDFVNAFDEYIEFAKSQNADITGSQPTQENMEGGLTTIEEKALGNIKKVPDRPIDGFLEMAETPSEPGLYFMNTSSSAQEEVTLMAAAGASIHLFSTGQGNPVGHQILPVIKISGNPRTVEEMEDNIDVDVSDITRGNMDAGKGGEKVLKSIKRVANGKYTSAEIIRHDNFTINRLYRSM